MNKPTLLYVEEVRNSLSERTVSRKDINLVILRFKQSMNFEESYIQKTADIPCFIFDKNSSTESEVKRFKRFCNKQNITIDYFYNDSEYNQELIQEFASLLKLSGSLNKDQSLCVRDKAIMKNKLQEIGYRTMPYKELNSIKDVYEFVEKCNGFPIIVKWRKGLSSKEVYKVNNLKQLHELNIDYSENRFIAEQYCPYLIWCVDSLVQNGKVIATFYAWLPYTNLSFTEKKDKFAQITVNQKPEWFKFDGTKVTQNIIDELKLRNGYMHLETFVDSFGQPTICEFAWRTPGEHMLSNHSKAFTIDVFSILIDIMIGIPKTVRLRGKRCVGDMFLPIVDGEIVSISSYSELKKIKGVIDGDIYYKPGDIVQSKRQYTSCSGWIQVEGKTKDDVLKRMLRIYKKFNMTIKKTKKV